uniref:Mucin 18B (inferred by orthology to a D. melanogaster protein) n=1 Tax=Strongyloides venezuelensis TaxID=75913 RepID=A0A0K0F3A3_STRVS
MSYVKIFILLNIFQIIKARYGSEPQQGYGTQQNIIKPGGYNNVPQNNLHYPYYYHYYYPDISYILNYPPFYYQFELCEHYYSKIIKQTSYEIIKTKKILKYLESKMVKILKSLEYKYMRNKIFIDLKIKIKYLNNILEKLEKKLIYYKQKYNKCKWNSTTKKASTTVIPSTTVMPSTTKKSTTVKPSSTKKSTTVIPSTH